ncbi:general substrate transporter [Gautieria morchelliformis]|nr:general substrate transporter [Gautieria morchelliformis]
MSLPSRGSSPAANEESDLKKDFASHIHHNESPRVKPKSPEERQAGLKAALKLDPGVSAWSARALYFYLIVLCVFCCSGDNGFDGTVMSGINAMTQYQTYFHMSSVGSSTGIVFGIFTLGSLTAAIPASYLPDRFGRRFAMFCGNLFIIVGAIVTANSKDRSMFVGGRYLTALAATSAKVYLAEMAPPQSRGRYMGFLNSFFYVGQITATGIMVASGRWQSNNSWRVPLYIQCGPAVLNVIFVFLCPESPRWLYAHGRPDQARALLAKLHSYTGDINSPIVNIEIEEIKEKVALDGADTLLGLQTVVQNKTRQASCSPGAFGQLSGNGLITYFLPVLLANAGITCTNHGHVRLTLNFVNSVTSFIGALTASSTLLYLSYIVLKALTSKGSLIVDHFGRRRLTLTATGTLVILLAIISALLSNPGATPGRSNAGISFIYLFMVVFSFGWTPIQSLYPAEILGYESRAKGLSFLLVVVQAVSCINTFALPVALAKLGWKVYLIFLFWDAIEYTAVYFTMVETKGLSLEQIDEVFNQPNPRKYSIEHRVRVRRGHVEGQPEV